MKLWTELLPPKEQTDYARLSLQEREEAKGSLSAFLPVETIDDITMRFERTQYGMVPTAEYRSFDAEASIGDLEGGERVTIDLAPVSRKIRVGELDQLRAIGSTASEALTRHIGRATDTVVTAIADRLEVARGSVLETGRLTINEGGFKVDYDLGRDPKMNATAATKWDQDASDPLEDIQMWADAYEDLNGVRPGAIVVSGKVRSLLRKNMAVRKLAAGANTPNVVSLEFINESLLSEGLPALSVYSRRANVGGKVRSILSDNKILLLPAPGNNTLGRVFMGRTLESAEPNYGIAAADRPGIVAGTYRSYDPISTWVHANAIALPGLVNPNASMVAQVLD